MAEHKDPTFSTATLDPEDAALLAGLTPEGPEPGTPAFSAQTEQELEEAARLAAGGAPDAAGAPAPAPAPGAPAPAPAPAPAAPAPSPAPAAPAPAPTEAPAPAPGAAPAPTPAPADGGDARAALRHARRNEKRLADQLRAANERLAELEAARPEGGSGTPASNGDRRDLSQLSEEEIADLRENYPLQYAMLEELRDVKARLNAQAPAPAPAAPAPAPATEWQPTIYEPEVQEVIDEVPTLLRWQMNQADQPKFNMAATFDTSLRNDPEWAQKAPAERFAEAVRLTELRLGLTAGAAPAPAPAAAPRTDPATAIAAAPSTQVAGISDFRGGGGGGGLPPLDYSRMDDAQILGSLRPEP